jgi:hypothetical protein
MCFVLYCEPQHLESILFLIQFLRRNDCQLVNCNPSYCYPVVTSHRDQKELRCSGISPGILCGHFSNVLTTMFRIISIHLYLLFTSVRTIPFRNICKFGMRRWRHCMMASNVGAMLYSTAFKQHQP